MAADPIIYCLEHVTDYDQFERLCHDLMVLEGYHHLEPLGGSKDKGRDVIHVERQANRWWPRRASSGGFQAAHEGKTLERSPTAPPPNL
jgi:hypothetical protein